jgi:hypothetical protein
LGQAEGSLHAFVQVPQMHCSGPHSESVLQRSSQCVALSVPALESALPQESTIRHAAISSPPAAANLE